MNCIQIILVSYFYPLLMGPLLWTSVNVSTVEPKGNARKWIIYSQFPVVFDRYSLGRQLANKSSPVASSGPPARQLCKVVMPAFD